MGNDINSLSGIEFENICKNLSLFTGGFISQIYSFYLINQIISSFFTCVHISCLKSESD